MNIETYEVKLKDALKQDSREKVLNGLDDLISTVEQEKNNMKVKGIITYIKRFAKARRDAREEKIAFVRELNEENAEVYKNILLEMIK